MTAVMSSPPSSHIPVDAWLSVLDLKEYSQMFSVYHGVEDMLEMTETDILKLGVTNSAHRARIVTSLVMLREKRHKRLRTKSQPQGPAYCNSAPGSAHSTPPSHVNHPDYANTHQESPLYQPFNQVTMPPPSNHAAFQSEATVTTDMLKQPWYHGNIARQKSEKLAVKDSDFLVRDSVSQPGDYVLTVHWGGSPLHFVINRQVLQHPDTGQLSVQYQFEEGLFYSVPALVEFYRGSRKPVSAASGAVLGNPIVRNVLLEYYDSRLRAMRSSPVTSPFSSPRGTPSHSPQLTRRRVPRRAGSFDLLLDDRSDMQRPPAVNADLGQVRGHNVTHSMAQINVKTRCKRTGSDPLLLSPAANDTPPHFFQQQPHTASVETPSNAEDTSPPPPKPSRIPTMKRSPEKKPVIQIRNKELYEDDGKDYSDYDQVKSWPSSVARSAEQLKRETASGRESSPGARRAVLVSPRSSALVAAGGAHRPNDAHGDYDIPKSSRDDYDIPKSSAKHTDSSLDMYPTKLPKTPVTLPDMQVTSAFDLANHSSEYLTPQNKPLEASAIATMKMILLESPPKLLAQHIAYLDFDLVKVMGSHDLGLGVHSGLELITLPQGQQMRRDILERYHCLHYFVSVITLVCTKLAERARMLSLWVHVAAELRSHLGDLYGFSAVMAALGSPQISRLASTWQTLKQKHHSACVLYESKLHQLLKEMNQAASTLPLQNITIPHIIPLVELIEHDLADPTQLHNQGGHLTNLDLDNILGHLDIARLITEQCGLYRATSESVMKGFRAQREIKDIFCTETHLKVLWGSRGVGVGCQERYPKFEQLLTVLSEKAEPAQTVSNGESSL